MAIIKSAKRSERKAVRKFIDDLVDILSKDSFDIEQDIILIKSQKAKKEYSTDHTLVDLDYDVNDVVERLKELTVEEYSETLFDCDDTNPPLLFVFGKDINKKTVYIKLKIKGEEKKYVLCISFHYAERAMNFPYA